MMPLTHGSILQGHHLFRLVELDTQGWIHCPILRCQAIRKVDQELVSPRLVWVIQDVAMLQLEGVPFKDGTTFCSSNDLLLILMKTNQGVAQNLLVHISMVLWAQIFGLSGCIAKPTRLHMHVMVLCQVLNKEPCGRVCGQTTNHLAYPTLESLNLDLQVSQYE